MIDETLQVILEIVLVGGFAILVVLCLVMATHSAIQFFRQE